MDIKRQRLENGYSSKKPLDTNNFLHHPKSVVAGVVLNDGLANVSFKSDAAVNYVLASESMMKLFGLIKTEQDLIDYNVTEGDLSGLATAEDLQRDIELLEKNAQQSQEGEKLDLLKEIKSLADEFSNGASDDASDADDAVTATGIVPEDDFHNDKIRSIFEKNYNCKVLLNTDDVGVSDSLPTVSLLSAAEHGLAGHLRVVRVGKVNL